MRLKTIFRRSAILVAVTLIAVVPTKSFAAPVGSMGRAIAELLGLLVAAVPDQLPINVPLLISVVSPDRLAAKGLTGLKAGDQVKVTLLANNQISVVPVVKATTTQTQISTTTTIKSGTISSPTATTTTALKQSLLLTIDAKGAITSTQLIPLDTRLELEAPALIKR